MSDSPQGGDETPDYPPHRPTYRTTQQRVCPRQPHQQLHPLTRDHHHFHRPVPHHLPRPFRSPILFIPRKAEPITSDTRTSNRHRHPHLLHPLSLRRIKAGRFQHPTSRLLKIWHCFLRETHLMMLTSLTSIPLVPIHHHPPPLRTIRSHLTFTPLTLQLMIRLSCGGWKFWAASHQRSPGLRATSTVLRLSSTRTTWSRSNTRILLNQFRLSVSPYLLLRFPRPRARPLPLSTTTTMT